ncbi:hypothetical protein NDU88_003398 [Pleurodeles waltl]|uniref:t-SNARE coiled-coil homology domain-containing protein n=1 Tax=Pleurodeles waltl TaxID=8319 RepID=A0AAV7LGU8_PLEWA|nr:hypothetical protein NDU88_003398 [Pleurodeles waltl]
MHAASELQDPRHSRSERQRKAGYPVGGAWADRPQRATEECAIMAGKSKAARAQERSTPGITSGEQQTTPSLLSLETTLQAHSTQLEKILQAIMDTKASIENRIDTVSQDLNLLRVDHRNLTDRVGTVKIH